MPTPDTSPKAVARVLRDLLAQIDRMAPTLEEYDYTPEECAGKALADALDAAPAVSHTPLLGALTKDEWAARVERGAIRLALDSRFPGAEWPLNFSETDRRIFSLQSDAALRASFPELAPADDR